MKKLFVLLITSLAATTSFAQTDYWQQEAHYTIDVALNDQAHSLHGNLSLNYVNHSPDTLTYIWFHLWPNAYKNDSTALAKQLATEKDAKKPVDRGYIDSLRFTVNGKTAPMEAHAEHIDLLKVVLPEPLLPGAQITIATPFHVQLPVYYSRSGHDGQHYMICQWYPKPAVYDRKGWHAFPYLNHGEFYSEYGSFSVKLALPAEYVVGATGTLKNADELEKYIALGTANNEGKRTVKYKTDRPGTQKVLQYYGDKIHDFAWFASKDFIIRYDTLQLTQGEPIRVFSFAQSNGNKHWKSSISYIKDAVRHYSGWLGDYPYPVVQAVEGPKNVTSGGMEYPMITLITSPEATGEQLDGVITHEVGHNWLYGILGSNERDHPWMDEGINTWFQFKYEAQKYKVNSVFGDAMPKEYKKLPEPEFLASVYNALNSLPAKQPVNTASSAFANKDDYSIVVYLKTAVWLYLVETAIGKDNLEKGMHEYFNAWKFRHPYPEDMKAAFEKGSGYNLDKVFDLLNKEDNF